MQRELASGADKAMLCCRKGRPVGHSILSLAKVVSASSVASWMVRGRSPLLVRDPRTLGSGICAVAQAVSLNLCNGWPLSLMYDILPVSSLGDADGPVYTLLT